MGEETVFYHSGKRELYRIIGSSDYLWWQRTPPFHSTSDKEKIICETQIRSNKYIRPSKLEGFIM